MNTFQNRKSLIFGTGASSSKDYDSLRKHIRTCLKCGIMSFDTAPSYRTEKILGIVIVDLLSELSLQRKDISIQTKIDPQQMQEGKLFILKHIDRMITEMGCEYFDSLLIHWPVPAYFKDTWEAICDAHQNKLVKRTGICNLRLRHLHDYLSLAKRPDIVQVERNPLRTCLREIDFCQKNGIEFQAYSPLCKMDSRISESKAIQRIATKYKKSVGQIVMRWHIDTGCIPVFTSQKEERIKEYSDIFDFELLPDEIADISSHNVNYKMYLESIVCPGF